MEEKRVLLVDDEVDLLEALKETLEFEDYSVSAFNRVDDAMTYLRDHSNEVNLIISDMRMPQKTGLDLALFVRKELKLNTPFMMISGFADITEQQLQEAQIKEFISKPFTLDLFLTKIKHLLSAV